MSIKYLKPRICIHAQIHKYAQSHGLVPLKRAQWGSYGQRALSKNHHIAQKANIHPFCNRLLPLMYIEKAAHIYIDTTHTIHVYAYRTLNTCVRLISPLSLFSPLLGEMSKFMPAEVHIHEQATKLVERQYRSPAPHEEFEHQPIPLPLVH